MSSTFTSQLPSKWSRFILVAKPSDKKLSRRQQSGPCWEISQRDPWHQGASINRRGVSAHFMPTAGYSASSRRWIFKKELSVYFLLLSELKWFSLFFNVELLISFKSTHLLKLLFWELKRIFTVVKLSVMFLYTRATYFL